jgi:hypothetical protein
LIIDKSIQLGVGEPMGTSGKPKETVIVVHGTWAAQNPIRRIGMSVQNQMANPTS